MTLKRRCYKLERVFGTLQPGSEIDLNYNPTRPTRADLKRWDNDTAVEFCKSCFLQRVFWTQRHCWPGITSFYTHIVSLYGLDEVAAESNFVGINETLANPSHKGFVQTEAEAIFLVEACIRGDIQYSGRGPQREEILAGSNTFVLVMSTSYFNTKADGIEWSSPTQDNDICISIDGSGMMKRTFRIGACGATHFVISYAEQGEYLCFGVVAREAKGIPKSIRMRMPEDLLQYVLTLESTTDICTREQAPADVAYQTISEGSIQWRLYFPNSPGMKGDCTTVCAYFPGG